MTLRKPNDGESIKAYDELQTAEINKVADYVVEQGSNYTKWNSGKLEQWGYYTSTGANSVVVPFPISFTSTPRVIISGDYVSGEADSVNYIYTRSGISTASTGVFIRDSRTGSAPTGNIALSYIAYGRWK